jgi:hypothetical protein
VKLVDETARCLLQLHAGSSSVPRASWDELSDAQRSNVSDHVAAFFLAMDEAMVNLDGRGEMY